MNSEVFENCSTILLDIAGTIGSINYTKDTLFAYAKKYVEEYLTGKWEDEQTKKVVAELKADGEELSDVAKAVVRFNLLTSENSTNTSFKTLQGLLYTQGYATGVLKAHVFDDVKTSMEQWSKHRKICIYSTGAEEAQKQYFAHSTAGDLTGFITRYFDQTVGVKTSAGSYESIAKALDVKPTEIVFLSDDLDEIKAAAKAGCVTVLVTREGNATIDEADKKDRLVVSSFADLPLSAKRKVAEEASSEGPPAKVAKLDAKEPATETAKPEKKVEKSQDTKDAVETMEVDSSEAVASMPETKPAETKEKSEETLETPTTTEKEVATDVVMEEKPAKDAVVEASTTSEAAATVTAVPVKEQVAEAEKTDDNEVDTTQKTETATLAEETKEKAEKKEAEPSLAVVESTEDAKVAEAEPEAKREETLKEKEVEKEKENGTTASQNGGEKVENGQAKDDKEEVEEKENKSEIANGTAEVTNNTETETEKEKTNGTEAEKETTAEEVKVKKMEEKTDSATAAVTVKA